ncbi:MAG: ORF6C domain-containing protein [Clostridia bacterium]|nr:ORF6C domain-containing protein [Clostridia bacterium]
MSELITAMLPDANGLIESAKRIQEMAGQMRLLADMLRETNARMAAMEKTIRTLEKVTPRQAAEINARIRERAAEVCREYRAGGQEKAAAAAIRKDVRNMTGVRTAREIARCDFGTVTEAIRDWDDYQAMKKIRQKGGARG